MVGDSTQSKINSKLQERVIAAFGEMYKQKKGEKNIPGNQLSKEEKWILGAGNKILPKDGVSQLEKEI